MGVVVSKTTTDVTWENERCQLRVTMVEGGTEPSLRVEVGADVLIVNISPEDLAVFGNEVMKQYAAQEL